MAKFFRWDGSVPWPAQRKRVHSRAYDHCRYFWEATGMDPEDAKHKARIYACAVTEEYVTNSHKYKPID